MVIPHLIRLNDKLIGIIYCKNEKQFLDNLAEIQVAMRIVQSTVPVMIEPLVPESLYKHSNEPTSPDLSVKIGKDIIFYRDYCYACSSF